MTEHKFKVGDKIINPRGATPFVEEILFIGKDFTVFRSEPNDNEYTRMNFSLKEMVLYEPTKKTVKMWPAIVKKHDTLLESFPKNQPSPYFFDSKDKAYDCYGDSLVSWPAIMNHDGSYDVPVEDK